MRDVYRDVCLLSMFCPASRNMSSNGPPSGSVACVQGFPIDRDVHLCLSLSYSQCHEFTFELLVL